MPGKTIEISRNYSNKRRIIGTVLRTRQNEDTLWREHCVPWCFPTVAKSGKTVGRRAATRNVSEDFQNKFCVQDATLVSATNVARVAKRVNIWWEIWWRQHCCLHTVSSFCQPLIRRRRLIELTVWTNWQKASNHQKTKRGQAQLRDRNGRTDKEWPRIERNRTPKLLNIIISIVAPWNCRRFILVQSLMSSRQLGLVPVAVRNCSNGARQWGQPTNQPLSIFGDVPSNQWGINNLTRCSAKRDGALYIHANFWEFAWIQKSFWEFLATRIIYHCLVAVYLHTLANNCPRDWTDNAAAKLTESPILWCELFGFDNDYFLLQEQIATTRCKTAQIASQRQKEKKLNFDRRCFSSAPIFFFNGRIISYVTCSQIQ